MLQLLTRRRSTALPERIVDSSAPAEHIENIAPQACRSSSESELDLANDRTPRPPPTPKLQKSELHLSHDSTNEGSSAGAQAVSASDHTALPPPLLSDTTNPRPRSIGTAKKRCKPAAEKKPLKPASSIAVQPESSRRPVEWYKQHLLDDGGEDMADDPRIKRYAERWDDVQWTIGTSAKKRIPQPMAGARRATR